MAGNTRGGMDLMESQKFTQAKEKKKKEEADKLLASLFKNA